MSDEEFEIIDTEEITFQEPQDIMIKDTTGDNLTQSTKRMMINDDTLNKTPGVGLIQNNWEENLIEDIKQAEDEEDLTESDLNQVVEELRHLEERIHLWTEVRQKTIESLRDIAEYMDSVTHRTGLAKIVGSGGGILAGGLTLAGGVMTILTAGAAAPVLIAGASLGLASGITGASASITKKILASQQMKKVEVAIEVDSAATSQLVTEVDTMKNDSKFQKVTGTILSVGGLASSTKGLMDLVKGATPGQTIIAGLETVGSVFGENFNKEIAKLVAQGAGRALSGTVTSVFGGVTMLWDMYQLRSGIRQMVEGPDSKEAVTQIREIARQLEEGLRHFSERDYTELD